MIGDRAARIDALVALAVKNDTNPNKNNFVGFTRRVSAAKFQSSPQVMHNDTDTLVKAWYADRWCSIVQNNPYLTPEEIQAWTQNH